MKFMLIKLIAIQNGTIIAKTKAVAFFAFLASPLAVLFENIFNWYDSHFTYISFVLVAIIIDHLLGSYVHAYIKKDFSMKKNIQGFFIKTLLVVSVAILVEGLKHIAGGQNLLGNYIGTVSHLMVFIYPAGSAFISSAIITKGKFPPMAWMTRIANFNKDMDIGAFEKNKKKKQ